MSSGVVVVAADWPAPPGVVAGTTTRAGGVSLGPYRSLNLGAHVGDDPDSVSENRRRLHEAAALPATPRWLAQVHRADIALEPAPGTEADAALTRQPGTVLAVMTADCLPVVVASGDGGEVAAVHAGWRGLVAGVLENTVAHFLAAPADMVAWLGPAISQAAFEVGDEVRAAFLAADRDAGAAFVRNGRGRWQADLYALARSRLAAAGVLQVYGGGHCTFGEPTRFFSYRRDGQCGRMATYVFRRD